MGKRGRTPSTQSGLPRGRFIGLRVDEDERDRILAAARLAGRPPGVVVREAALALADELIKASSMRR